MGAGGLGWGVCVGISACNVLAVYTVCTVLQFLHVGYQFDRNLHPFLLLFYLEVCFSDFFILFFLSFFLPSPFS